ncbi:S-adenosyl-L-methionine-dependent methyltransferase [Apiospora aurea]|uniref:S-adenosyl-L-methionine-dependent methyltransferase n=1 Tax=Apiospora aurea TaxID=335848 RepID=A0ABR1PZH6_9PEZI
MARGGVGGGAGKGGMNFNKARTSYSDNSMASASGNGYAESQLSKSPGSVVSSDYWPPSVNEDGSDSDEVPSAPRIGKRSQWALGSGTKNPACHVLGIDVEPVVPPFTLPNCAFETVDITKPWPFESKFDYIHARGVPDFPPDTREAVYDSMWNHLSPGGWIECTNWVMRLESADRSTQGTRCEQWFHAIERGVSAMGGSLSFPLEWKRLMTARGCKNLQIRKYPVPLNAWPPSERLQKIGSMMTENTLSVVDMVTGPVLEGALRWSKEDCDAIIGDFHKELPDTTYHPFIILMTTYGQKPF